MLDGQAIARVSCLNFERDEQSDLTVHGGDDKAVYVYPSEHYEAWCPELPDVEFPHAVFGENLTTEGLSENVRIGDRFRVGTAEFIVTQPRLPCYKLGIRFGRMDMLKRMLRNGRTGSYFAVTAEGEVGAGDAIEPIERVDEGLTVADVVRLYTVDARNQQLLFRATQAAGLLIVGRTVSATGSGTPTLNLNGNVTVRRAHVTTRSFSISRFGYT